MRNSSSPNAATACSMTFGIVGRYGGKSDLGERSTTGGIVGMPRMACKAVWLPSPAFATTVRDPGHRAAPPSVRVVS